MGTPSTILGLATGLMLCASAWAGQWFAVASPGTDSATALVEIDLDTLRTQGGGGEAVIRVTSDVLQPHVAGFGYRSFIATAQFDCGRRTIALASAAYFALPGGEGQRLGADSSGREAGMPPRLLESMPAASRQALLKAICARAQAN